MNARDSITVYASDNVFRPVSVVQKHVDAVALGKSGVVTVLDEGGNDHEEVYKRIKYGKDALWMLFT